MKVKRPTLPLHKFAGACEVINWPGVCGADHQPAIWCYLQIFLETKLNFLRSDFDIDVTAGVSSNKPILDPSSDSVTTQMVRHSQSKVL